VVDTIVAVVISPSVIGTVRRLAPAMLGRCEWKVSFTPRHSRLPSGGEATGMAGQ